VNGAAADRIARSKAAYPLTARYARDHDGLISLMCLVGRKRS